MCSYNKKKTRYATAVAWLSHVTLCSLQSCAHFLDEEKASGFKVEKYSFSDLYTR